MADLLAALSPAEGDVALAAWLASRADPAATSRAEQRADLEELHRVLIRLTSGQPDPPELLTAVTEALRTTATDAVAGLSPRPRVVIRLLVAGHPAAAWAVATENAVGVVSDAYDLSTTSGVVQAVRRLPLVTDVQPPTVFAWLPGFRDPRYAAPDDCYDITDKVRVRHQLDAFALDSSRLRLGGWAVLEPWPAADDDQVSLVLDGDDAAQRLEMPARRSRRADLVSGTGDGLTRRAWAGWWVEVDPKELGPGTSWRARLRVARQGIDREASLGSSVAGLAAQPLQDRVGRLPVGVEVVDGALRVSIGPRQRWVYRLRRT